MDNPERSSAKPSLCPAIESRIVCTQLDALNLTTHEVYPVAFVLSYLQIARPRKE